MAAGAAAIANKGKPRINKMDKLRVAVVNFILRAGFKRSLETICVCESVECEAWYFWTICLSPLKG